LKVGDVIWVTPVAKANPSDLSYSQAHSQAQSEAQAHFQVALEQEPVIQGALFSIDARTGEVLAMVGGYDFSKSEFNRAMQALRQPGSAFKPIIYAAALEKGFTPTSVIVDSPLVFRDTDGAGGSWKPNNYEEKFYGDTTFRQALIKSRNIPTVKIVQAIQIPYLIQYAKRLGMNGQFNTDLSISLGSNSISLFDLTKVFALFPRLGRMVSPVFYNTVIDRDGKLIEAQVPKVLPAMPQISTEFGTQTPPNPAPSSPLPGDPLTPPMANVMKFPNYPPSNDPDQILDPRVAYVMTHLMTEVVTSGTGHAAKDLGRNAAGKTGTTNESVDAWFVGFTPDVVTGVWVGFDNQKSIGHGETGAKVALPIWLNFMKAAVKSYPESDFVVPPGIAFASIDPATGKLSPPNSSSAIREAFIEGTQPTEMGAGEGTSTTDSQVDFFKEDRD
jgi:penicillin-binding protein 1A